MRPTQGPHNMGLPINQRPRSKTNKLYYYQGYHDGSSKYKKKPPKGMYINHDDVVKLAALDLKAKQTPVKQPPSRNNDFLMETEHEIAVLHGQVRIDLPALRQFSLTVFSSFFTSMFMIIFYSWLCDKKIQKNKQKISFLKAANEQNTDVRLPDEIALNRVNPRWAKDEISLAVMGFRQCGQNFKVFKF